MNKNAWYWVASAVLTVMFVIKYSGIEVLS